MKIILKISDFDIGHHDVVELRHCKSLNEIMMSKTFFRLKKINFPWPKNQDEGKATMLALMAKSKKDNSDAGFIKSWGKCSVDKRPTGFDINENRFIKLIQANDWDEFYNAAATGVKVLNHYAGGVDIQDMEYWIRRRADEWANDGKGFSGMIGFAGKSADVFYQSQPKTRA